MRVRVIEFVNGRERELLRYDTKTENIDYNVAIAGLKEIYGSHIIEFQIF